MREPVRMPRLTPTRIAKPNIAVPLVSFHASGWSISWRHMPSSAMATLRDCISTSPPGSVEVCVGFGITWYL